MSRMPTVFDRSAKAPSFGMPAMVPVQPAAISFILGSAFENGNGRRQSERSRVFEHDQSKLDYRLLGYTKAYFSSILLSTPRSVVHVQAHTCTKRWFRTIAKCCSQSHSTGKIRIGANHRSHRHATISSRRGRIRHDRQHGGP